MAASEQSATQATFQTVTDWSIAVPAAVDVGDLLVAFAANGQGTGTFSAPGGWTVGQTADATGDVVLAWAWKVATSTEQTGSIAFAWSATRTGAAVLIRYGSVAAAPMDTAPALLSQASGTTWTSSSITPSVDGCLIVCCAAGDDAAGNLSPQYTAFTLGGLAGVDEHNFRDAFVYVSLGVADRVQTTAAAITAVVTKGNSNVGVVAIMAVAPALVIAPTYRPQLIHANVSVSQAANW